MATIIPFRGILYNLQSIPGLQDVVTPPYDVISNEERDQYYDRHPNNVIRLVLNRPESGDHPGSNRYTRAAGFFNQWLAQGVVQRDQAAALYVTETDYLEGDTMKTRLGFIALVQLEEFEKGGILPHEKTFSATKVDRLHLMRASRAHFCPIFSIFPDPQGNIMTRLHAWTKRIPPDLDFEDSTGLRQRLWRMTDQGLCREAGASLLARPLFIADGHHRYETALNFRNEMHAQYKNLAPDASCNYVLMYLCSMQDPGLALRPVHRLVADISPTAIKGFSKKAVDYFDLRTFRNEGEKSREDFLAKVSAGDQGGVMGVVFRGENTFHVLRAKERVMDRLFEESIPGPLRKLDVTVVTKLIIEKIMGLDPDDLDDPDRVLYTSQTGKAFAALHAGKCDAAIIMNPTRLAHVEEISRAGLIMPRKSTYFYPKVLSGLVMNKIDVP